MSCRKKVKPDCCVTVFTTYLEQHHTPYHALSKHSKLGLCFWLIGSSKAFTSIRKTKTRKTTSESMRLFFEHENSALHVQLFEKLRQKYALLLYRFYCNTSANSQILIICLGQNSVTRRGLKPQYLTTYFMYDTNFRGKTSPNCYK